MDRIAHNLRKYKSRSSGFIYFTDTKIDRMTHSLKISFKDGKRRKHLSSTVTRIFRGFKMWLTIRIQILSVDPIFSFSELNAPLNYNMLGLYIFLQD